ncbi:MAG: MFS transporter [Rhodocyclaceae bacterium]|nr:MFS transporter [Rhodocyclaceae bacterium]MBP7081313.1 MFS transporter [Rhodocyclaceae bacterium]
MSSERNHPPPSLAWTIWGLGAMLYLIGFYQRVAPAVITDQLMRDFAIGGAALGNLSAFYFYSYVAMQIPTGVIADHWGPRRLLTAGAAVAAIGSAVFALAPDIFWANAGRLLIGASVAVAFVSMLKLANHWFSPQHYALAAGMALLTGVSGGVVAGVPLRYLVEAFGWRGVMGVTAALTALLALAIWLWVRDDPVERGYASYFHDASHDHASSQPAPESTSIWRGLMQVLSYRNIWVITLVPIGFSGAVLTFAGLWGVPYLRQVHGLDALSAAAITSTLLVAWAAGGPTLGAWSQRQGRRKRLYLMASGVALLGWAAIFFLPLPLWLLVALLIPTGFASGNITIGFAWARESVPPRLVGTASGVVNMGPLMGGMMLQPAVGWMLDQRWQGGLVGGVKVFDAAAYQAGFTLIFLAVVLASGLIFFGRESFCKQMT